MDNQQRDSVVIFRNQLEALLACSPKDCRLILAAMREYGMNGNDVDMPEHLAPLWIMFKFNIDENNRKRAEVCEKRRQAALSKHQQMQANGSKCNQMQPNATKCKQMVANGSYNENENDNELSHSNEYDNNNAPERIERVSLKLTQYPQSVDEVLAICTAIKSPMSIGEARSYLDWHIRTDWHQGVGGTGRKIKIEAIPADIRLWIDRKKAEEARQAQQQTPGQRQTGTLVREPVYSSNERGNNNAGNR